MNSPSTPALSLRTRMIGATQWVVLASGLGHVLRLVSNLILTRLLVPEMFGLMSIATTVSVIVSMLSDIGLRQAVVRSTRGDEKTFLDSAWTVQVGRGFVLWGGSLVGALGLYIATHFGAITPQSTWGNPILPLLIAVSGFAGVVGGFSSTLALTAVRNFELRPVFLLDFIGQIGGLTLMVVLGWWTRSIWALVFGSMASVGISAVLSHVWMRGPRNRFRWEHESIKELFAYGKWLALSSSVTVFATNGDRLMLAAYANAHLLGLYSVALSLVGALDAVLTQLFDRVMLPAFSEVARKNPAGVPNAFFRLRWRIDPVILVCSGLLCGGAHLLIGILYDKRYAEAGQMLQILSLGMIVSRYAMVQQVYLAIGQTRYFVPLNLVRLISTYAMIPLGYRLGGFTGSIIAIALRDVPMALFSFYLNSKHHLNNLRLELGTLAFWPLGYLVAKAAEWAWAALR
jgi:O-antigen/teichoic acid export membrane protein